ncbi:hypothetical protein Dimus_036346, partial [Dionaea muscipula]
MHHLSLPTPIIATGPPLPAITTSTCSPSLPITIATHARKERAGTRQAPPTSCCQHHRSPPEKEESTSHLCLHGSPPRQEEIDVVMDPKRVRVFLAVFLILEQRFFTIKEPLTEHREPPHPLAHHPPSADSTTTFADVDTPPVAPTLGNKDNTDHLSLASSTTEEDEGNVGLPSPIIATPTTTPTITDHHRPSPTTLPPPPPTPTTTEKIACITYPRRHRSSPSVHLSLAITTDICSPSLPITIATHARKERARNTSSTTNQLVAGIIDHRERRRKAPTTSRSHGSPPRQEEIDVVMDPKRVRVFLVVFLILEQRFFTIK